MVGVSTRAIAESAANVGFRVTSLDAFGDLDQHPGVRALSMRRDFGVEFSARAVANLARSIDADSVAYLSPFENYGPLVARMAKGRRLLGNTQSVVARARDPRWLVRPDATSSGRWLVKPRRSGGGHNVRWWNPGDPVPGDRYRQAFVEGVPGSIVFVAAHGTAVPLGLTTQLVGDAAFGASGFRYCGSILTASRETTSHEIRHGSATHRDRALLDSAITLASRAARELELVGLNCIDFIDRDGTAYPIEINPRWSASMELVERAHHIPMFGVHATACTTGELPAFDIARAGTTVPVHGKAIVFARHDVICGDTREWLDDRAVRDVPHPGEPIRAGRPVCTVFASAQSADDCRLALVTRANVVYDTLDAWSSVHA